MSGPNPTPSRRSNDIASHRDARICWLLDMHPVTAAMLVGLGWFPTRKKARKRLLRLVERRRIRLVGTVCRKVGRQEHVYCPYQPAVSQLLHEVQLTELCLRIDAGTILRGPEATDERVRPDAEMRINGQLYYLELDRATMGYRQIERRFRLYEQCPHLSLWVCSTQQRREGLRTRAGRLHATALFTTFAEAMASPHGEIWWDFRGGKAALPREVRRKGEK
jgi:hypothetical protein